MPNFVHKITRAILPKLGMKGQNRAGKFLESADAKMENGDFNGAAADYIRAIELDPASRVFNFRTLYDLVLNYEGDSIYETLLAPLARPWASGGSWLGEFASRQGDPVPAVEDRELYELYALSRINDLLLLNFQPQRSGGSTTPVSPLSWKEYHAFFEMLGFSVVTEQIFSPFFHEIVEVDQVADAGHPVTVTATCWPCLMLGGMLFSRAGVKVKAGSSFVNKQCAESSILYWTHRRKNRPVSDLSAGWGSNSQWGTRFRRDYRFGQSLYYNVDGENDVFTPDPEDSNHLTPGERLELLTNRCFVSTTKYDDEMFPYKDRYLHVL